MNQQKVVLATFLEWYAAGIYVFKPKLARRHWSGQDRSFIWNTTLVDHPIDGAHTVDHRKKACAVDYYLTSAYVHCPLPAIDNYFTEDESVSSVRIVYSS